MLFNLKVYSGEKKISYRPLSLGFKYVIDEKKLEESIINIVKVFNVELSELQKKNFLTKEGCDIRISKHDGKPDAVILSRIKIDDKLSPDYFRNHMAGFIQQIEKEQIKNLHIFIPKYLPFKNIFDSEEYFYQTFAEGVLFGNYSFVKYKSVKKNLKDLSVYFHSEDDSKMQKAIATAKIVMGGVDFAKDLQNEPGITLTPEEFANRLSNEFADTGVKVKIFDEKEIRKRKMGGLSAVGMGSDNPPRMIILEYNGLKNKSGKSKKNKISSVALVGKGITFDSGGISIKPSLNMGEMKGDMSGAAVVAGAIKAAARARLPLKLLGVIASAENMPSGKALRPGDVITASNGKSIEVDDTDAEGRVVLADALVYASNQNPDVIIDLATLTGHVVVALGEFVGGIFTKDKVLSDSLFKAGLKSHDRLWPMPMWDDYSDAIKSEVADIKNYGIKWGGAVHAAKFLENFVDGKIPWAHLDIAGPAMANSYNNYTKKYMTGYGVRLLFEYLKDADKKE
ncbi:MAG: leucyl aminopeptidase [Ignavibacteriaceae bacterium]